MWMIFPEFEVYLCNLLICWKTPWILQIFSQHPPCSIISSWRDVIPSWPVLTRPQLFASLLLPGQHQHGIHRPEAFSVWQFQLGQDFVGNLLSKLSAWYGTLNRILCLGPYGQGIAWPGSLLWDAGYSWQLLKHIACVCKINLSVASMVGIRAELSEGKVQDYALSSPSFMANSAFCANRQEA